MAARKSKRKLFDVSLLPANVAKLLDLLTVKQRAFVLDASEYVSGLCPRRAGKTFAAVVKCILWGFRRPHATLFYLALTKGQGARIVFATFRKFDQEFGLELKILESKYQVVFPNGSMLTVMGAERISEIEKLRGNPYDLVVIDEGRSYADSKLRGLQVDIIDPGLGDYEGTCAFIGTPGRIAAGLFYEATTDLPGWSKHHWSLKDNVAMPQLWERACEKRKEFLKTLGKVPASFVVEYEGQWAFDRDDLVFPDFATKTFAAVTPDSLVMHISPDTVSGVTISERPGSMAVHESFREYFWDLSKVANSIKRYSRDGALPVYIALKQLDKKFITRLSQYLGVGITILDPVPREIAVPFVADCLATSEIQVSPGLLANELKVLQYEEHTEERPTGYRAREFAEQLDAACTDALFSAWALSAHRDRRDATVREHYPWYSDEEAFLAASRDAKAAKNAPAWRR